MFKSCCGKIDVVDDEEIAETYDYRFGTTAATASNSREWDTGLRKLQNDIDALRSPDCWNVDESDNDDVDDWAKTHSNFLVSHLQR